MNYQVLFVVLSTLAVCVTSITVEEVDDDVEPVPESKQLIQGLGKNEKVPIPRPIAGHISKPKFNPAKQNHKTCKMLFTKEYRLLPVRNKIQSKEVIYYGSSKISAIEVWELGKTQNASAGILEGGVGTKAMKNQLLFAVLLMLAVLHGINSAATDLEIAAEPIEIIESAIEPGAPSVTSRNFATGIIGSGDRLLYRNYFTKSPLANYIQTQDITYRGNTTTRITYVSAVEVGYTQYATAYITAGGVGWNNVTVRLSTARSYGYYFSLEIWGR